MRSWILVPLLLALMGAAIGDAHPKGQGTAFRSIGGTITGSPFSPAPIAYWRMESVGSTIPDSMSGNPFPLAVTGSGLSSVSGGVAGNRLSLSAGGTYSASVVGPISGTGDFTVSVWVIVSDASVFGQMWDQEAVAFNQDNGLCASPNTAGTYKIRTYRFGSALGGIGPFNENQLYHMTYKFVSSSQSIFIAIDGANFVLVVNGGAAHNSLAFRLGTGSDGSSQRFGGYLDEVAVWNVALTNAQNAQVYARGLAGRSLL